MIDLVEIYVHWYAGRSQVQIADSLGLDRKTVRKYLGPVVGSGLVPGGPPVMTEEDWRARAQSWFPALVDKGLRQVSWPSIEVHRDYITAQLAAGVTVSTIYQRLVDEQGLVASVASLRRWVGGNLPEEARRAQVRVLRPGSVEPGSEAQIDYGRLGVWTDPATGRRYTVQAFVMVLACSTDTPVFASVNGDALTRFSICKIVRRHAGYLDDARTDRRASPHIFRHTAAVHMLEAGVEINVIRGWLGHADLTTTNRYAEINTKAKMQALRTTEPPDTSAGSRPRPAWRSDESLLNWLSSL